MPHSSTRLSGVCCALGCLLFFASVPVAKAAFSISINGTEVATDNGVGDHDSDAGTIRYIDKVGNYQIRITCTSELTASGSKITATELRISSTGRNGSASSPLEVTISNGFRTLTASTGEMTLTNTVARSQMPGFGTDGTISSQTAAESRRGDRGETGELTLTSGLQSGVSYGSFFHTDDDFNLSQTINIAGLRGDKKVKLVAAGMADPGNGPSGPEVQTPAPPAIVLLGVGVALVGAYQLRSLRRLRPRF